VSKDDLLPGSKLYTVNMQLKQSEAMVESLKKQLQQAQLQIELYSNNSRWLNEKFRSEMCNSLV